MGKSERDQRSIISHYKDEEKEKNKVVKCSKTIRSVNFNFLLQTFKFSCNLSSNSVLFSLSCVFGTYLIINFSISFINPKLVNLSEFDKLI